MGEASSLESLKWYTLVEIGVWNSDQDDKDLLSHGRANSAQEKVCEFFGISWLSDNLKENETLLSADW